MKDLIRKLKLLYFKKIVIPRYIRAAKRFGEMLSYSYMGEAVSFKKLQKRIHEYMKFSTDHNIKPWDYNEMAGVGWNKELPELKEFTCDEEKAEWISEMELDQKLVENEHKRNLAQVFSSMLKDKPKL